MTDIQIPLHIAAIVASISAFLAGLICWNLGQRAERRYWQESNRLTASQLEEIRRLL